MQEFSPLSQFAMDTTMTPAVVPTASLSSSATQASSTHPTVSLSSSATQASSTQHQQQLLNNIHTTNMLGTHKLVIDTLTKLYNETYAVLGGAQAVGVKKQEIDDNWQKLGALFGLLNNGEISVNASNRLADLCRMLDRRDFGTAFEILASLSTSRGYEYECNLWMAALKRMLNTRVNGGPSPSSRILSPQQLQQQLVQQHIQFQQAAMQRSYPAQVTSNKYPSNTYPGIQMPQARRFETNNGLLSSTPIQPSNPIQPAAVQPVVITPTLGLQNVDTSSVPAQQKPVITTLIRLLNETNEAKKQEIRDNITKMTTLFGKLNRGEISTNAAEKIVELCQALDRGDFATALQIQVQLSTSHWNECNFWLGSLKRMTKQNERNQESFFA